LAGEWTWTKRFKKAKPSDKAGRIDVHRPVYIGLTR